MNKNLSSAGKQRRSFINKIATTATGAALSGIGLSAFANESSNAKDASLVPGKTFDGKVVLITGAGRGIGRASAIEFANNGAKLALLDIANPNAMLDVLGYPLASQNDLDETARLVRQAGADSITAVADVRDINQMKNAVDKVMHAFGRIDVVIACAGVGIAKDKFENYDAAKWKAIMDVNLYGVANTVYASLEPLKKANGARIVIISSRAGRIGTGLPAYGSSKWAATGLMKNLAIELAPFNIRVNCVAPGTANTDLPLYQNELPHNEEGRKKLEEIQNATTVLPTGLIDPKDLAKVIAEAAGPAVHITTGATFDANGGSTARTSS